MKVLDRNRYYKRNKEMSLERKKKMTCSERRDSYSKCYKKVMTEHVSKKEDSRTGTNRDGKESKVT